MKPYFSIVIPYHNSQSTIEPLLQSIYRSKKVPPLEVIIVDDGSLEPIEGLKKYQKPLMLQVTRLEKNRGPAVARNRGVDRARGKYLVFLDSDVELFPDALHNLWSIYEDDPDITAVTGVWVKHQRSKHFFPNFKALRDWSYWINERDKSGYYYLFSTRIASIKRDVFIRLHGFDEEYNAPLVEDIEFTYRIARRYAIIFAPTVRVRHEFEEFLPIAKKYFWRSFYWTKLYQSRKKFDPVATTLQEAATALSGVGIVGLICLAFIWQGMLFWAEGITHEYGTYGVYALYGCILFFLLLHVCLIRKFLHFVYEEKGLVFAVQSFFTGLVLYCFIALGAAWGRLKQSA